MKKNWNEFKKEKQSAIFDSAIKVIRQKGFHRMRMVDIAKEAGISYGLVYHYFKNKESLVNDIQNQWWEELYRFLESVRQEPGEFHDKLKKIILYFLDLYQQKPDLMNIFITQISRSSTNLTRTHLDHFKQFISLTEGILSEGQKDGFLRQDFDAPYLTFIFLGALETFITIMVMSNRKIRDDQHKERITQSILEVFLNGARNQN